MLKNIRKAASWRIDYLLQQSLKLRWHLKRTFDFSEKEKVNAISLIVVGRNDNYGGDFSKRLQTTLDWNLMHLPNPEVIYVEWNQIKERESDCQWITERYPNAKCFIVSKQIHDSLCTNVKIPMLEYHAKNLGMKKACNDWFLIINSDCMIGTDVSHNIKKLSRQNVYGTHYVSIKWDGTPIQENYLKNKKNYSVAFPAGKDLSSVVGNFILTHKKNWLTATGYDERLTDVRAGVDSNGLYQLLYLGLKPMIIGHHFHLDHPESIIFGSNETHGKSDILNNNIPYKNKEDWGLANYSLKQISERVWELEQ